LECRDLLGAGRAALNVGLQAATKAHLQPIQLWLESPDGHFFESTAV
jgi:hypothetical protein